MQGCIPPKFRKLRSLILNIFLHGFLKAHPGIHRLAAKPGSSPAGAGMSRIGHSGARRATPPRR